MGGQLSFARDQLEKPVSLFLQEIGFDAPGLAAKGVPKYFLTGDQRLSVTLLGGHKSPEFLVIEWKGGSSYAAVIQTPNRERLRSAVEMWKRLNGPTRPSEGHRQKTAAST